LAVSRGRWLMVEKKFEINRASFENVENYLTHFEEGVYQCANCQETLFSSTAKFKANNCTWPTFRAPVSSDVLFLQQALWSGINRTEVSCNKCKEYLGEVYLDGRSTGDTHPQAKHRYCISSKSIQFKPVTQTSFQGSTPAPPSNQLSNPIIPVVLLIATISVVAGFLYYRSKKR